MLLTGRHGGEYRVCPSDRKLAGKHAVTDEYPDMIDPQPDQRGGLFGGLDLVDLHQHVIEPNQ